MRNKFLLQCVLQRMGARGAMRSVCGYQLGACCDTGAHCIVLSVFLYFSGFLVCMGSSSSVRSADSVGFVPGEGCKACHALRGSSIPGPQKGWGLESVGLADFVLCKSIFSLPRCFSSYVLAPAFESRSRSLYVFDECFAMVACRLFSLTSLPFND